MFLTDTNQQKKNNDLGFQVGEPIGLDFSFAGEHCEHILPHKITRVELYYLDIITNDSKNEKELDFDNAYHRELAADLQVLCREPTNSNEEKYHKTKSKLDTLLVNSKLFSRRPVLKFHDGKDSDPLFQNKSRSTNLSVSEKDRWFTYTIPPNENLTQGNYFLKVWYLREELSNREYITLNFLLEDNIRSSFPVQSIAEQKYQTLLEEMLPEIYKTKQSDHDVTPDVLRRLHNAIGKGFFEVEKHASQLISLFDANSVHKTQLPRLAALFSQKLYSQQPSLWRRQIRRAVPTFKSKGTKKGLIEAAACAGFHITEIDSLWQVQDRYKYVQELVFYPDEVYEFKKPNFNNAETIVEKYDTTTKAFVLTDAKVLLSTETDGSQQFSIQLGNDTLSPTDSVKITYPTLPENHPSQVHSEPISQLPLSDKRSYSTGQLPPKDWNTRLISKKHPHFLSIVDELHPYHPDVVFGQIRSQFPYGEKAYNMDAYDGSLFDTTIPCQMENTFQEPCGRCLSSWVNFSVMVEDLSQEKIDEFFEICESLLPAHIRVHQVSFGGAFNSFQMAPVDELFITAQHSIKSETLSDSAKTIFNRYMSLSGGNSPRVRRDDISQPFQSKAIKKGKLYNTDLLLNTKGGVLALSEINYKNNLLVIPSHYTSAGRYTVEGSDGDDLVVKSEKRFIHGDQSFRFSLKSLLAPNLVLQLRQQYKLSFEVKEITTDLNLQKLDEYEFIGIASNGSKQQLRNVEVRGNRIFSLQDNTFNIQKLQIHNKKQQIFLESIVFNSSVTPIGLGIVNESQRKYFNEVGKVGHFLRVDDQFYKIENLFKDSFQINGYQSGGRSDQVSDLYVQHVESSEGSFFYKGFELELNEPAHLALGLPEDFLSKGLLGKNTNPDQNLENYLIKIEEDFYKIEVLTNNSLYLQGPFRRLGTKPNGGDNVNYVVYHFRSKDVDLTGNILTQHLSRDGSSTISAGSPKPVFRSQSLVSALSTNTTSETGQSVSQMSDQLSMRIEYLEDES